MFSSSARLRHQEGYWGAFYAYPRFFQFLRPRKKPCSDVFVASTELVRRVSIDLRIRAVDEPILRSLAVAGRRHNRAFVVDDRSVRCPWILRTFTAADRLDLEFRIPCLR